MKEEELRRREALFAQRDRAIVTCLDEAAVSQRKGLLGDDGDALVGAGHGPGWGESWGEPSSPQCSSSALRHTKG